MIFDIKESFRVDSVTPIISSDFIVLHFDEIPILYAGKNHNGDNIIGSVMCEDDEIDITRHIHVVSNIEKINEVINGDTSYRSLIDSNESVYIIDKDINDNVISTYLIPLSELSPDYLPRYYKNDFSKNLQTVQ